jgi:isoquinoline 1-oxidoreductase alpha subunit
MKIDLNVNGQTHSLDVDPDTPLLWVLREQLGLTGTKFGCGIGACGACTIHLGGTALRSCVLPAVAAAGAAITTIEGLSHAVQDAWIVEQVPQCGYCQSGQLMAAASLLKRNPSPTDADIDASMTNLCRCATYPRIRAGIHRASAALALLDPPPQEPPNPGSAPESAEKEGAR